MAKKIQKGIVRENLCSVKFNGRLVMKNQNHEIAERYAKNISKKGLAQLLDYTGKKIAEYKDGKCINSEQTDIF